MHVSCPPGGETDARAFYGSVLGLAEVDKPPALTGRGGVWFRGESYELHVGIEEEFLAATKAHPAFDVQDIDRVAERVRKAGHHRAGVRGAQTSGLVCARVRRARATPD
ncbi:MAG: glyoxalase [Nocardioidaceae bacterium]